jgi:hypothetical protein
VRGAAAGAACLESTPSPDLSDLPCACGCLECATACDGEGLVVAQGETVALVLHGGLPASGSLGAMVRARGSGTLSVTLMPLQADGTQPALDPVMLTADFADSVSMTRYSWTGPQARPTLIELTTDAASSGEVDCVVPFLVP